MKGTTNAQRNAVVGSSSAVDKLTLTLADGTTQQHTVSDMIPKDAEPTTGSAKFVTSGAVKAALDEKVDAEAGKGLSTNDYTTTEKNKLSGIATGAQVNVIESVKVNGSALTPSGKAVNIDLSGYATRGDLSSIPKFAVTVVTELPTSDISTSTIYLKSNGGSSGNSYDEYIYVNSAWEKIGTTEVDLSDYVPTTRKVNNKALSTDITLTAADLNISITDSVISGSSALITSGGVFSAINTGVPASGTYDTDTSTITFNAASGAQLFQVTGIEGGGVQFTLEVDYTGASDLSGISVTATPTSGATATVQGTTNASGKAYLTVKQNATYTITSSKSGYKFTSTPSVTCTDLTTVATITCFKQPTVTLTVTDSSSAGLQSGRTVKMVGSGDTQTATTNSSGVATFVAENMGSYTFSMVDIPS
ncbi:MAG: hypothetical protein ACI38Y_06505, partial [Candidatus Methanomethylophilaceae archaeon]